jgi:hypothetical protein
MKISLYKYKLSSKMKQINKWCVITLFFFYGFGITTNAQNQNSSLLWEISGKDLTKPSYFFGTIHALPHEKFFLPSIVKEKFNIAEKIVLELNLSDPAMMFQMQSLMIMKDTLIDNLLAKEDLNKVTQFFADSLGIQLSMVSKVKPFLLAAFIIQKFTGPNPASYEQEFLQMSKSAGKQMVGLETVQEQISCIDKIPLKEQAKLMVEGINDYNKSKQEFLQLVDTYISQDIERVYKLMMDDPEFKSYRDILINDRNQKWVSRIEKMINEQSCFIAVGCGHLAGEKGILALMQKEGYTVKPVK